MRREFTAWRLTADGLSLFSTAVAGPVAVLQPTRDGRTWHVRWPDGTRSLPVSFRLARDIALQRAAPVRQNDVVPNAQAAISARAPA
jgi:hypothetical protein